MGGNSFLLKGWSITLIIAITTFALSIDGVADIDKQQKLHLVAIATFLVVIFWVLDAFYLSQERAYRGLYDEVRVKSNEQIDYSLDARKHLSGRNTWFQSLFSNVFLVFYGSALVLLLLILSDLIGINFYIK